METSSILVCSTTFKIMISENTKINLIRLNILLFSYQLLELEFIQRWIDETNVNLEELKFVLDISDNQNISEYIYTSQKNKDILLKKLHQYIIQ